MSKSLVNETLVNKSLKEDSLFYKNKCEPLELLESIKDLYIKPKQYNVELIQDLLLNYGIYNYSEIDAEGYNKDDDKDNDIYLNHDKKFITVLKLINIIHIELFLTKLFESELLQIPTSLKLSLFEIDCDGYCSRFVLAIAIILAKFSADETLAILENKELNTSLSQAVEYFLRQSKI